MSSNLTVKQDNSPVARLKRVLNADSVQQQFKNALKENAALFCASLIDLYANDQYLQRCEPNDVIMEALKAATLKLPINKSLGFAYIVPYKNNKAQKYIPTMIIGYKGYLQLAQRTAQYKYINADCIYEGEVVDQDRLTGEVTITGEPTSDIATGYFAHIETITGFKKTVCWTKKQVEDHAKQYSQSYHSEYSPWKKQFDTMAIKTVIRHLINRYGIMSVDMIQAIDIDSSDFKEQQPESKQQRDKISYEPTAQPPEQKQAEPIDLNERRDTNSTVFETDQGIKTEHDKPAELDEFGTPLDSPMSKGAWWNMRAGDYAKGTGFAAFLNANRQYFNTASDKTWEIIIEKYAKIYDDELPWDRNGNEIGPPDKDENAKEETGHDEDTQAILDSPAAQKLAEIASKHPEAYKQVVQGQVPNSIHQIITWMEEINKIVVESRLNK